MKALTFWVEGKPVSKGRARSTIRNGKIATYTPAETRAWEERVRLFAQLAARRWEPRREPAMVEIDLHGFGRRSDIDNGAKAVLDAGNRILYADDCWVDELRVRRILDGAEGARVTVTRLGP